MILQSSHRICPAIAVQSFSRFLTFREPLPAQFGADREIDLSGISMKSCGCKTRHQRKRVVLTGGPGAGKTAVLELVRQEFCLHVRVLPEAAGIIFGGGFPREATPPSLRAAQRAIFHVETELEALADEGNGAIVLCDRGTVDSAAYWPGPGELWPDVGTTL